MKPIKYTGDNNNCTFHYKYGDLKEFILYGKRTGAVGMIIISKTGNIIKHKGFGTIENPGKEITTMRTIMFEPFGGKFNIDTIMNPKPIFDSNDLRFVLLDLSETNKQIFFE